jgi:hypothetical protein
MPYQLEEAEQMALFRWAKMQENVYPDLRWLHHIPNGGHRHKSTAARLKAAGVKAGVPDLCLPVARCGYHGLYIEMKAGKNDATPSQKKWLKHLREAGYKAAICRGWSEAKDVIVAYLTTERR